MYMGGDPYIVNRVMIPYWDFPPGTVTCTSGWDGHRREDRGKGTLTCWQCNHTQALTHVPKEALCVLPANS